VIGNHEVDSSNLLKDYLNFFGLENNTTFNHKNVHFLALTTEIPYYNTSEQYKFAVNDLEKNSKIHL
jgi:hypothetical protein